MSNNSTKKDKIFTKKGLQSFYNEALTALRLIHLRTGEFWN